MFNKMAYNIIILSQEGTVCFHIVKEKNRETNQWRYKKVVVKYIKYFSQIQGNRRQYFEIYFQISNSKITQGTPETG